MSRTKLEKTIKREIKLRGVDAPVVLTITPTGMHMAVSGTRLKTFADWDRVCGAMRTPMNVPSFLADKPLELLKYQAAKQSRANKVKGG